jgi:hypothetical protein
MGNRFDEVSKEVKRVPYKVVKGDNNTPRVNIEDRKYSPQEISAMILQKMKKKLQKILLVKRLHKLLLQFQHILMMLKDKLLRKLVKSQV